MWDWSIAFCGGQPLLKVVGECPLFNGTVQTRKGAILIASECISSSLAPEMVLSQSLQSIAKESGYYHARDIGT
jgi:hypothetical protein